jgi:hypothetical protein
MAPIATINPELYGANYIWYKVSQSEFPAWSNAMRTIADYRLARYPDGWGAEHYDWQNNTMRDNFGGATEPGVDPETFLSTVPQADFVTPSMLYIENPTSEQLKSLVEISRRLVKKYSNRVKVWEIGNEWWLQRSGLSHPKIRAENLTRYAELLAAVVPAMKAAAKAAGQSIQIYMQADWTQPSESAQLRQDVIANGSEAAWDALDGVSVHSYVGVNETPLISQIRSNMKAIQLNTQKTNFFSSEWSVTKHRTDDDYGMHNANYTALALQQMVFAGITKGCYWPPSVVVPYTAFVSNNYQHPTATGTLYGWMSQYYEGTALQTTGTMTAIASSLNNAVNIIIPSQNSGLTHVQIPLTGTHLSHVLSAEVMYSANPDDSKLSQIVKTATLPTFITVGDKGLDGKFQLMLNFYLNPGTTNRGSSWEIARISLQ